VLYFFLEIRKGVSALSKHKNKKAQLKTWGVRIVCIVLAALMLLSVVASFLWIW